MVEGYPVVVRHALRWDRPSGGEIKFSPIKSTNPVSRWQSGLIIAMPGNGAIRLFEQQITRHIPYSSALREMEKHHAERDEYYGPAIKTTQRRL